jgi:hypothetical protein
MNIRSKIDESLLNRIVAAAYGDGSILERIKIYFLALRNKEVQKLFNEYKKTANAVGNIEIDKCPEEIIEKIKIKSGYLNNNILSSALSFLNRLFHKPIYAVVVTLIFISAAASLFLLNQKSSGQVSNKHIAQAEKQVKQSLVFVNRIFEKTAGRVENDILKEQVAKPVHEGILTINKLFKGG